MLSAVLQQATNERPKRGRKPIRNRAPSLGVNVQERILRIERQDAEANTDTITTVCTGIQAVAHAVDAQSGDDYPIREQTCTGTQTDVKTDTRECVTQTDVDTDTKGCDTSDLEKHIKDAKLKRHMKKQAEIAAAQRLVLGAPAGDDSDE